MFIVNWFKTLAAHPKTTLAGIGSLVGAAAISYGMATGKVPVNETSIATAGGLVSAGLAGLNASDSKAAQVVTTAAAAAPAAIDIVQKIEAAKADAKDAQTKLDAFAKLTSDIAAALPPEQG